ncbi:hypothetical protein ACFFK0_29875 [Paenibacillus chartarius]|uniref:Uncharacterized protein n=1 Tax=Paenibacillus chartarius TaxID=747481 RepID=A0ABV6DVB7_9BACL
MDKNRRLRDLSFGSIRSADQTLIIGAGSAPLGDPLSSLLAKEFNHNFDEYDQAIDAVYNQTHIGGSGLHHLLDGQHTVWGAFEAVRDVRTDDTFVTEMLQAGEHLLRDMLSKSGINPLFSLSKEQFDQLGNMVSHLGVSKTFLADALTFNGPELLGGMGGLAAALLLGNQPDPSRLSRLSGGLLVSSLVTANPILFPIAAGGMVYAAVKSGDPIRAIKQSGKGAFVSGSALLASTLVGGPVWIGCLAGVATALLVSYAITNPSDAFRRVQTLIQSATQLYRKVSLRLS